MRAKEPLIAAPTRLRQRDTADWLALAIVGLTTIAVLVGVGVLMVREPLVVALFGGVTFFGGVVPWAIHRVLDL